MEQRNGRRDPHPLTVLAPKAYRLSSSIEVRVPPVSWCFQRYGDRGHGE